MKVYRIEAVKMDYYRGEWGPCGSFKEYVREDEVDEMVTKLKTYNGTKTRRAAYEKIEVGEPSEEELKAEFKSIDHEIKSITNQINTLKKERDHKKKTRNILQDSLIENHDHI